MDKLGCVKINFFCAVFAQQSFILRFAGFGKRINFIE